MKKYLHKIVISSLIIGLAGTMGMIYIQYCFAFKGWHWIKPDIELGWGWNVNELEFFMALAFLVWQIIGVIVYLKNNSNLRRSE